MPKQTNSKRTAKQATAKKVAKQATVMRGAKKATAKAAPAKKVAKAAPVKTAAKKVTAKTAAKAKAKAPAKKVAKAATAKAPAKRVAKAATAKAPAKAAAAKRVAKAATVKKVTAKAPAKKLAKAAIAEKPAKKVAKAATAERPAKKVTAKAPAKKVAKAATAEKPAKKVTAKAAAKKVAKAASPAGGGLASWSTRLDKMVAALRADAGVKVLAVWRGEPISSESIAAVEGKLGARLDPGIRDFYAQANGLAVVWVLADAHVRVSLKQDGRPSMQELEELPPSAGVIALIPLEEVFGVDEAPFFDYARFMPETPPHWGFDFPGNFYTPAFVRVGSELRVKVGDDHGAAWDGKAVTFEMYLEGVLATWALVAARADVFIHGKGRAKPMTLAQALAEAQRNEP